LILCVVLVLIFTSAVLAGKNRRREETKSYKNHHKDKSHYDNRRRRGEGFPSHIRLRKTLQAVVSEPNLGNGFNSWVCLVDRDGVVVDVAFTGENRADQFPGSRHIACAKANTANSFSLPKFTLSTANLYAAVQPGGSLFEVQEANPLNSEAAYRGPSSQYGKHDPWIGHRAGGSIVFGGGLALYNNRGVLLGALGVSGDTSCTDHVIAWKLRYALNLDNVPAGPAPTPGSTTGQTTDNMILDFTGSVSASGFGIHFALLLIQLLEILLKISQSIIQPAHTINKIFRYSLHKLIKFNFLFQ